MKTHWRSIAILLMLFTGVALVFAQEDSTASETILIAGSGVVNPVLQAMIDAGGTDLNFDVSTTGSAAGFEQFCSGAAQITTAARTITAQEDAACRDNEIGFLELLVGYDVLAIISNPDDDFAACLTEDQINTIFAPGSAQQIVNWNALNEIESETDPAFPELDLQVFVPEDNSLVYAMLDDLVAGIGLRSDATVADFDAIVSRVAATSGALGVVSFEETINLTDVQPVAIDFGDADGGCEYPSVESAEAGLYPASIPFFVYVNRLVQEPLGAFLDLVGTEAGAEYVIGAGYTPVSADAYATNRAIISGEQDGRVFVSEVAEYQPPEILIGEINIGGATSGNRIADPVVQSLSGSQTQLAVNHIFDGAVVDTAEYCDNALDILFINAENAPDCSDSAVTSHVIPLGYQVAVLVGNDADEYTTCLTTEQIATIWSASSTDIVTNWNIVAESMPDQAMTLFGIREGNALSDVLLGSAGGVIPPVRIDTETNGDALYRAAAVANVTGSLTYMSWNDYQRVLANGQEHIQLVLVNSGNGCVLPTDETIRNGQYPLVLATSAVINQSSLARPEVQGFLWAMFDDTNFAAFSAANMTGFEYSDLAVIRNELVASFETAQNSLTTVPDEVNTVSDMPDTGAEATAEPGSD